MMSIQLLYSRQVPRTINCDPDMLRGTGDITNDEVLAILSQVQHKQPIGNAVLNAQIALDQSARALLIKSLTQSLIADSVNESIATALAKTAVFEVCDSPACPRCKGTGLFIKPGKGLIECSKCHGVGNFIPSGRALYNKVISYLPEEQKLSLGMFNKKWYDTYMEIVDRLHSEAGDAANCAKGILRQIENTGILIR